MFGFLTLDGKPEQDLLLDQAAAEEFLRSLPLDDPLETLKALCEAISNSAQKVEPHVDRLNALIGLDRRTERLCEQLLINSVERSVRSSPLQSTIWQAVLELSSVFAQAYEQFMRHMRDNASNRANLERAPGLLIHLFRHRRIESLVALFRYEQLGPRRWRELHEAYQFAHSRQFSRRFVQTDSGKPDAGTTVEREYLCILLSQLLNNGQFTPRESLWASRWVHAGCKGLPLEPGDKRAAGMVFALDLAGAEGLKRPAHSPAEAHFCIDPTPMLSSIDHEIRRLREAGAGTGVSPAAHTQQLALLGKIKGVLSPKPIRIRRRGERETCAAMTVQVFAGLSSIIRMLHDQSQKSVVVAAALPRASGGDDITITQLGGTWRTAGAASDDAQPSILPTSAPFDSTRDVWRMKNRSESGTLLRGRVEDASRVVPGSLIVFRVRDDEQWTVAIVRRLKRFVRNNVEIGVEHIGRGPQGVTIVADNGPRPQMTASSSEATDRFAGLYLREIIGHSEVPLKTLLLPASEFKQDRGMTLLSTTTSYGLRLKEPLEVQVEFVWTPFEVVTKQRQQPSHAGDQAGRKPAPGA